MTELLQPVTAPPEPPLSGLPTWQSDPFAQAFVNTQGERVELAGGGPFAEVLKVVGSKAVQTMSSDPQLIAKQAEQLVAFGHQGPLPKYAININLHRLTDPQEINGLILGLATELKGTMQVARRGTRSNAVTLQAAMDSFRADEGFMFRRQTGEAANAEEITATRMVMASVRDSTKALAEQVVTGKASPEVMLEFRQSLSQMAAVQFQLHGMAAEAGRALQSFKMQATPGLLDLVRGAPAPAPAGIPAAGSTPTQPAGALPAVPAGPTPGTVGAAAAQTQDLIQLINTQGGQQGIIQLAQAFLQLGTPAAQNAMARASATRGPAEMLGELFYNFVLSGPATHVVNMTGNSIVSANVVQERQVAAFWGKLFGFIGGQEGVKMGEATAMIQAYWSALGDAWRLANFAFRHGESVGADTNYRMPISMEHIWKMSNAQAAQLAPAMGKLGLSKVATGREPAVTGQNVLNAGPDVVNSISQHMLGRSVMNPVVLGQRGALGRMTDLISAIIDIGGGVLRTPTRALGAEDQFFKAIAFRGEATARAYREGINSGLTGKQLEAYIDQSVNFMLPADAAAAENFARMVTMSETLMSRFARGIQQAGSSKLGYLFAPFVRVTSNILDYSTQRVAFPARPIWWKEVSSPDPAIRDLAMAKASTGAMVWMTAFGAASTMMDADEDAPIVVTGAAPRDPAQKSIWFKRGYKEYSVRLGGMTGTWTKYTRFDPAGQILGIAADAVNIMARLDDEDASEFAAALITGIGNNLVNKNYMQSIAESMEVFTSYDVNQWQKWIQNRATSFVVPNIVAQYAADQDPYLRRSVSIAEEIAKRSSVEGRKALPLKRDLAGYPIKQDWLFGSRFTGIEMSEGKVDPVADELARLQLNFSAPNKTVRGVELDEHQYDQYAMLAGHGLKMPKDEVYVGPAVKNAGRYQRIKVDLSGKGMWNALRELMRDPLYKAATDGADPPGQKASMILDIQARYKKAAQDRLMAEYPELVDAVIEASTQADIAQALPHAGDPRATTMKRATLQRAVDIAKDYEVTE